ncbi:hypothetical protein Ancab_035658, partial [Ancistrocladus abbreviatus]
TFKIRVALAHNRDEAIHNRAGRPKPTTEEQRIPDKRDYRTQKSYADALKQERGRPKSANEEQRILDKEITEHNNPMRRH